MVKSILCVLCVSYVVSGLSRTVSAQEAVSVSSLPDAISYATAFANPAVAAFKAIRSDDPMCRLSQIGIAGGITSAGLIAQRFIHSPRPCMGSPGCSGNGMPSLHSAYSVVGISQGVHSGLGFTFSLSMSVGTAAARVDANRHTPWQVAAGLALGSFSEWAGQKLARCK